MAITESHPARPGGGDPPTEQTSVSRRRSRWRGPVVLGLGALLTAAVVVLAVLAGTYQPVQFGGESGAGFPGLPTGTGIHFVNTFGGQQGELYVPPQAGVFTLKVSVYNTGPETVTIEAISILSPQEQASEAQGISPWPLTPAGQALWVPLSYRPDQSGNSVVGLSLTPGQDVVVGIPLRMSGICYDPSGWTRRHSACRHEDLPRRARERRGRAAGAVDDHRIRGTRRSCARTGRSPEPSAPGERRLVLRLPFGGGGVRRVQRPHLPLPARRPRRAGPGGGIRPVRRGTGNPTRLARLTSETCDQITTHPATRSLRTQRPDHHAPTTHPATRTPRAHQ